MTVVHHDGRDGGQFLYRGQEWTSVVHSEGGADVKYLLVQ